MNSWEVARIEKFKHLVQDSQGDVFVTAGAAVYKIGYKDKVIQLLAGAPERSGFDSLFSNQSYQIELIGKENLLLADWTTLRLIDLQSNKVSTLGVNVCCLNSVTSFLITADSLFVGQYGAILRFICEFIS